MGSKKLTRRQFAGAIAAAAAAPTLLAAQEKKPPDAKPAESSGDDESQAMKRIRDFAVPEGAEPAFAFQAS